MEEQKLIRLRRLNFRDLIEMTHTDVDSYTFDVYRENGCHHPHVKGYCIRCEEEKCNYAIDDYSYKLMNMSHGAHSSDFLRSLKQKTNIDDWRQEPVMFVYESPSRDYDLYQEVKYKGHCKRPAKEWYWIHEEQDVFSYPKRFRGGEYGKFVLSAIQTFKLANVYMTNLVKCGMNDGDGERFKGIASFSSEAIECCFSQFLEREIAILQPRVIFAVGSSVERRLNDFLKGTYSVQQLPHPAGRRRGFKDEHFKAIYFWVITNALHKAGIITIEEGSELARVFLEQYDEEYE